MEKENLKLGSRVRINCVPEETGTVVKLENFGVYVYWDLSQKLNWAIYEVLELL